ncbi:MAG: Ig-like domain-containing protein [Gammaproteobacteria bacterium]|nr:Ig-like domain-containing protein [Gammaproteobacteria bacterium]
MSLARQIAHITTVAGFLAVLSGCGGSSGNAPVAKPTLRSIALSPPTATVAIGATTTLTVTGTYTTGAAQTLANSAETFYTSDPNVATVAANGVVTGVGAGTASISATDKASGVSSTQAAVITVPAAHLVSIALSPLSATLSSGATETLTVTGTFSSGPARALTSGETFNVTSVPATGVVTVSASGVVTAVGPGTATISATDTASGITTSVSAVVTVKASLVSIALSPGTANLAPGGTQALTVVGTYNDGSTANLAASGETFATSNANVATVDATGLVTVPANATAGQTAVISATDNGTGLATSAQNSTTVTVTQPTTTGVLSTGFNSNGTTTTSSSATGTWSVYSGGANNPAGGNGGGYADQGAKPSYEYVYLQDSAAKLAGYTYQGVGIQPAAGQTVSTAGFDSLSFTLAINPEWLQAGTPNFVILIAGKVSGVSNATCNPQVAAVVTATASGATAYKVPLSAFTQIVQNCAVATVTPAQILAAPITEVDFQADGGGAAITASGLTSNTNTSVALANVSPAVYPTTVNVVGGVSFVP